MLKTVFVSNYTHLKQTMGTDQNDTYRNTGEVVDALQEYIDEGGDREDVVLIPYKCKPLLRDGDVIFRFQKETEECIYFEFETTVS
ncbi:hypothetical protein FAES_4035 [Fibrella aestuarina BUZ 2]|uniref:Uncharacterized protein n=1 Tax=Fibrella aestuarina BUZ 2 TaxID=1166018 RepID=I0KD32_9BACT|nr:hypothetical protein [Fibrella aestuarina]CCH02035.1 hypothetical protein FAES_4035 [Fibrella aestuarina BUZ 2]